MVKIGEEFPVIIKSLAYYKMLIHVLRFGSKIIDPNQCKEVMGGLIGYIKAEGDKEFLVIEDAVPVSHGGAIEVRYTSEQLGSFERIDSRVFEKFGDLGWFSCGWYHSHPNLTPFFSGTDIQNQLFWQARNPAGVGLVFDHALLEKEGNLGFKAFRLDDPSKTRNTSYHEVKTEVEPPNNVDYYNNIINLIGNVYSKEIPILELNETTNFFDDIFIPSNDQLMIKKPELNVNQIVNSFKEGISSFLEQSMEPLISVLNTWSQENLKKAFRNSVKMRKDIVELKTSLSNGMTSIQKTFNNSLHDELEELDSFIDDRLDIFDEKQDNLREKITKFEEDINLLINNALQDGVENLLGGILTNFKDTSLELVEMDKKQAVIISNLESSNITLQDMIKTLEPSKVRITGRINAINESILEGVKKKLKMTENKFDSLENESKKLLSDLKAAILVLEGSKEPIDQKLDRLELDKKNLHEKLKEIRTENTELLRKIKELEKEGE
ncbi:MAG: hypothetical protein KGD73_09235 [Candidatus Lokiarchaeota archaeon]|nr:hypothetical protein [Candidatus Lokiarchaeota archaeon]